MLVAKKYDGSKGGRLGRPRTAVKIQELILRMARENPRWGYTRIRGALHSLGHEISRNTIKKMLLEIGFDPVRRRGMSRETFLKAHWGAIAATDFFSVEVITRSGLVRYFVLFVIDLKTRTVEIPKSFRIHSDRFPVIRNREFDSASREILSGGTGLQAAAMKPIHRSTIWDSSLTDVV